MNNRQDILNELKTLSPFLCKLKENEKMLAVPENYFEELADVVLFQTTNENSVLAQLKKEKIEVPINYFENFGDNILSKIEIENAGKKAIELPNKKNKIIHLFSRVAIAASIVGAVFLVKQVQNPALHFSNNENDIASLTQTEIYSYMHANSIDFDVQDVEQTVQKVLTENEINSDIDKQTAAEYIEENINILESDDASTDIF